MIPSTFDNNNTTNQQPQRRPLTEKIPVEYQRFLQQIQRLTKEQKHNVSIGRTEEDLQLKTNLLETFIEDYDGHVIFNHHMKPIVSRMFAIPVAY